jgi:hypothetical protein
MTDWKWINPDYTKGIASIIAVLLLLIPWNVSIQYNPILSRTSYHARWWFGEFQYVPTADIAALVPLPRLISAQSTPAFYQVHLIWAIISGIFLVFITIAALIMFDEGPYQPSTPHNYLLMATPLAFSGSGYLAVTGWMITHGLQGVYIPVGAVFLLGFGLAFATNTTKTVQLLTANKLTTLEKSRKD